MLSIKKLMPALLMFILAGTENIKADQGEDKPWAVETSVSVYSDYMFRGFNYYRGTSIQPSITGTYDSPIGEFAANLWMHFSAEGSSEKKGQAFTEFDQTLSYTYSTEFIAATTGLAWFTYPDSSDDIPSTGEVFAALAFNTFLNPVISFYHDYDEFDYQYYELGFSHTFEEIWESASLTPYIGIGFASNAQKLYADDGLVQTTTGLALTLPAGSLSIEPNINYTFESDDNAVNRFWFGVNLTFAF